jgi:RNA polymerase sigma factor (sigma-70 family)
MASSLSHSHLKDTYRTGSGDTFPSECQIFPPATYTIDGGVEMVSMSLEKAVSATDPKKNRYCLLQEDGTEIYRCAETAANLGATAEETRLQAFWLHYKTHVEPYTRWAAGKNMLDPTVQYPDPREAAAELVEDVLLSFYRRVQGGQYDVGRGPPCKYVKRAIRNGFQDILRRGRNPTGEECARCYEKGGVCPVFGTEQPGERERRRCFRLPPVGEFDAVSAVFAAAGLQDQWPPALGDVQGVSSIRRPVEDQALQAVLIQSVWNLINELLTPDQRTVLAETFLHHKTSREIALMIHTTPGNVDQIRHRGLRRLNKVLNL